MTQWVYVVCKRYNYESGKSGDLVRPDGIWGVCTSHEMVEKSFPDFIFEWVENDKPTTAFQITGGSSDGSYWILRRALIGGLNE